MTTRRWVFFTSAVALLCVTGILLQLQGPVEDAAPLHRLETFPVALGGWIRADSVDDDGLAPDLQAEQRLARTFTRGATTLKVYVGCYRKQPPPSELFLPSRGWTTLERRLAVISLDARGAQSLGANLEVLQTEDQRIVLLYWYQIDAQSIAGEHWYRALLLWNRFVHGRAESALVRIASPLARSGDPASAAAAQAEFVRVFYPELMRALARQLYSTPAHNPRRSSRLTCPVAPC